ncbi:c-type cytochrome biogenesis protein CcmI (plasmid) [Aliiroseovarius crassostreae]|uniref:C-type cytochrome biogenesis protein CcmI n=1 Tax=Aliiroseovarius crassostreae TaxID=154981 RepID=A0A9Q9HBI4_9RHOB|nr:c-type cytochrome biogenesis protein CcmI [Aliiroseovarius crassostreae]UWP97059.1 c-type cytochrome biogenesis protein CcmI [Aliiroseovarius crassostreae]
MIWAGFFLMSLVAVLFATWPVFGHSRAEIAVEDGTSAVLIDQLDEVKRDLDRGLISAEEAAAAQLEIKRRILTLSRKITDTRFLPSRDGKTVVFLAALFVPFIAIGYYSMNGALVEQNQAFAEQQKEQAAEQKITDLTQKLRDRLVNDPNGGASDGWMLLGQTYMRMGRYDDAVQAFDIISVRARATSETWSRLAEALILAQDGVVTPRAETAIDQALALNASNPAAVFFRARFLKQAGDATAAHALLVSRLNEAEGFAPWMETFVIEANRVGSEIGLAPVDLADFAPAATPGPSAEDVAAAGDMSEEDRSAFIRSMVERLANRLEDKPDDLDGWMRLANAYSVLGERENAISAYEKASALLQDAPVTDPRRQNIERALLELKG